MNHRPLLVLALVVAGCTTQASPSAPAATPPPTGEPSGAPTASAAALTGEIAYVGGAAEDPQIHLLDLVTGESDQLTHLRPEHAELTASGPMRPVLSCGFGPSGLAWSPDGSLLAFAYGGCDTVVYVVDLAGELRRIGDGRGPAWSPDGTLLLHAANVPFSPCGVACQEQPEPGLWDLQVAVVADEAPSGPFTPDGSTSGAGSPTWSSDGSMIAYSGPPPRGAAPEVFSATYVIGADAGEPRMIGVGAWPLGWHPDGRLLITSEEDGSVHAVDLETGDSDQVGPAQTATIAPDVSLVVAWADADPVTGRWRSRLLTTEGDSVADLPGDVVAWAPGSDALILADAMRSMLVLVDRSGAVLASYEAPTQGGGLAVSWRPGS